MSLITAIKTQKNDKTRCNIEVDGRFYCGMKLDTVVSNRLKAGMQITEGELARMQLESEKQTALDKALTHISASMKTEREVRDFLKKKGYLDEVAEYVIGKMKEYGYLDDEAYAAAFAESAAKDKGSRLIAAKLRAKGVSEEAIARAVEGLNGEESAAKVLNKYLRGKDISDPKTLSKAFAYLMGRGFDYDTAREALSSLKEDPDDR